MTPAPQILVDKFVSIDKHDEFSTFESPSRIHRSHRKDNTGTKNEPSEWAHPSRCKISVALEARKLRSKHFVQLADTPILGTKAELASACPSLLSMPLATPLSC